MLRLCGSLIVRLRFTVNSGKSVLSLNVDLAVSASLDGRWCVFSRPKNVNFFTPGTGGLLGSLR